MNKILISSILAVILFSSVFTANSAFGADSTKEAEAKKKNDAKRQEELKKAKEKAKERAEQAKKMTPKMLQVYLNNLDSSYTLTDSQNDENVGFVVVHDSSQIFATKKGVKVLTMVIQSEKSDDVLVFLDKVIAMSQDDGLDVYTFQLSKEEKCVVATDNSLTCISGKYDFSTFSALSRDESFKFMDIMLKKYYKAQGKEFKQSTKQLSKKATLVPKIEKTYDEKINSLFIVEVIDCKIKGKYVEWKGSITSYASEKVDVQIILSGIDIDDNIVTFEKEYVMSLYPEQTQYISQLLDNAPKFDSCSYKIESVQ